MSRIKEKNIVHSRIRKFIYILSLLAFLLIGRLYYIQIYENHHLKEEGLKRRGKEVLLYPNRGIIFDRNLIPLTNRERIPTLIVPKGKLMEDRELFNWAYENTSLWKNDFQKLLEGNNNILKIPLKNNVNRQEPMNLAFIEDIINRYTKDNLLAHVIGYINKAENRGDYGIEKVYDEFLKNGDRKSLIIEYDKDRRMVLGGEYYVNNFNQALDPAGVQLTIDYHIQKSLETILNNRRINGAAIVAEASTGDIVAMASRPNFDQDNIGKYLDGEDMTLYNKAIQAAYPPGSVFKLVVLLAALEENMDYLSHNYYCPGYEYVGNRKINCNNIYGHGNISLTDAFSQSCNSAFIQLGKEIGAQKIIDLGRDLGLGEKINIGLLEEVRGNLPEGEELLGPEIGNISIGQGKLETTPLQISNMMLTILNKGIRKDMSIVKGITTKDGRMIKEFIKKEEKRVLSEDTSIIVKDMLKEVVSQGTAKVLDLDEIGGAGGKTGSAEAVLNKQLTIHGWFSGFYPSEYPKYIITVIVEDTNYGSKAAVPIFEDIAKEINRLNR